MRMFSFNHDVDKISYGYMTFSCGRSGDSGTVNINVSMQLIMIFNYFHVQKMRIESSFCDVFQKCRSIQ